MDPKLMLRRWWPVLVTLVLGILVAQLGLIAGVALYFMEIFKDELDWPVRIGLLVLSFLWFFVVFATILS